MDKEMVELEKLSEWSVRGSASLAITCRREGYDTGNIPTRIGRMY